MFKKYSIAIYPSIEIIEIIKKMKEQLAEKIGWFNSKNATAHITICEFKTTEKQLEIIKKQLANCCTTLKPFEVHLNHFDSYQNGAFFIAPEPNSKQKLKDTIKEINSVFKLPEMYKSSDPHLSIARKLTSQKIEIAAKLFPSIEMNFYCESIVVRELDEIKKQFFVVDTFPFKNNAKLIQGSLF